MLVRRWDSLDSPMEAPPNQSRAVPRTAGTLSLLLPLPEDNVFARRKEGFTSGRKGSRLHGRSRFCLARRRQAKGKVVGAGSWLMETQAWEHWSEQT